MTQIPRPRRAPLLVAGLILTSSTLVVVAAGPAAAAPVDGTVRSASYSTYGGGCDVANGADSETKTFTNATGERTAYALGSFSGEQRGGEVVGAHGESEVTSTASGTARNRAFRSARFDGSHVVVLTNDAGAVNCGMTVVARSEGDAMLRVRERGRIRIQWTSSGGDIGLISLIAPSGRAVVDQDPADSDGKVTVRVRRGLYSFATQVTTSASEADLADGDSAIVFGRFAVGVNYLRPSR
ncbi:hypothetical protein [Nocardioides pelophilus]|uniref:hypothetical protein n=1 Tax=Nocardioides pelophilus TaxID=2172019 RepID=UPI0016018760|nr:hypothetical protein [Nocardioides pelophilus]